MNIKRIFQISTSCRNVNEAFLVFVALALMAFLNTGQLWDRQNVVACYPNRELITILDLNDQQVQRIEIIQDEFESAILQAQLESFLSDDTSVGQLVKKRNDRILDVLSERQEKILNAYCADLILLAEY